VLRIELSKAILLELVSKKRLANRMVGEKSLRANIRKIKAYVE
jgi:hypothetical protein